MVFLRDSFWILKRPSHPRTYKEAKALDGTRLADEMKLDGEAEMLRAELERLLREKRGELNRLEKAIWTIASDKDEVEYRRFLSLWAERREDEESFLRLGAFPVSEFPDQVMNLIWNVRNFLRQKMESASAELTALAADPFFGRLVELLRRTAELGAACEALECLLR